MEMSQTSLRSLILSSGLAAELALLCGVLLILFWTWISGRKASGIGFWICLISLVSAFLLASSTPAEGQFLSVAFDGLSGWQKKFFTLFTSVALFSYLEWRNGRPVPLRTEFMVLLLLSQLSLMVLVQARSFLLMFLAAEGFSLCAYGLARPVHPGKEAASTLIRYFLSGSLASGIGLFGLSWLLGFQGTLLESPDLTASGISFFPIAGAVFFSSFLLFKLGSFPFHFWVPGVFGEAPTPVAGYLAAAPKAAAAFALLRLVEGVEANLSFPLLLLALAGTVLGNLGAFGSDRIRNILGYSAIGQAGLLLIPAIFSKQIAGGQNVLLVFAFGSPVTCRSWFRPLVFWCPFLSGG